MWGRLETCGPIVNRPTASLYISCLDQQNFYLGSVVAPASAGVWSLYTSCLDQQNFCMSSVVAPASAGVRANRPSGAVVWLRLCCKVGQTIAFCRLPHS